MRFPDPLRPGRLVRRYKRFLADVLLDQPAAGDSDPVVAHCPNPGAMTGLDMPESPVWLSPARSASRKLRWTLEIVGVDDGAGGISWVGINTGHPNALVAEAIAAGRIPALAGYATLRREVAYGTRSRIDILLEDPQRPPCYVEVKNVHLERPAPDGAGRLAAFPDSVTTRGAKHLVDMAAVVAAGARAVMLYCVQRADCRAFTTAPDIDPAYDSGLRAALEAGVEALCYECMVSPTEIRLTDPLPLALPDAAAMAAAGAPAGRAAGRRGGRPATPAGG